jgi:hypothetical protein
MASSPPVTVRQRPLKRRSARPSGRTDLRTFVACVPLDWWAPQGQSAERLQGSSRIVTRAVDQQGCWSLGARAMGSSGPEMAWSIFRVVGRCLPYRMTSLSRNQCRTTPTGRATPVAHPHRRQSRMRFPHRDANVFAVPLTGSQNDAGDAARDQWAGSVPGTAGRRRTPTLSVVLPRAAVPAGVSGLRLVVDPLRDSPKLGFDGGERVRVQVRALGVECFLEAACGAGERDRSDCGRRSRYGMQLP